MKLPLTLLALFILFQISGQNLVFLKTKDRKNLHYIQFNNDTVKVYKMGWYFFRPADEGGPAIRKMDTLVFSKQNEWKGRFYSLEENETMYTLINEKGKKYPCEPESEPKVTTELNHAYCVKSYYDLSRRLNKEFPMYHYSFMNGFDAWENETVKSDNYEKFRVRTENEIARIYDSIAKKQKAFTKTTDFISTQAGKVNYMILKDSLATLPIDYRSESGYFDKSVYHMAKANPEYFYQLLQDFPSGSQSIYFVVNQDKALVKQLKQVQGYDSLKKEFIKDYRMGKRMAFMGYGTYAIFLGLITWLIIGQP